MRWVFVLLLVLNGFYFVWSQLETPAAPKELAGLPTAQQAGKDIRLLSESGALGAIPAGQCLYLGGFAARDGLAALLARLEGLQVSSRAAHIEAGRDAGWWLRITPPGAAVIDGHVFAYLSRDIKDLKRTIIPCEGVASVE